MRRNVIALSLVLPLLFLFTVFSSAKTASLGVRISASGIEILNRPEEGYVIDLAEYAVPYRVAARVLPEEASNRGFVFLTEGDGGIYVDGDGAIVAQNTGEARVTVRSKDGGYEDSARILVYSSAPNDFSLSLTALPSGEELLEEVKGGYEARLSAGRYALTGSALPGGFVFPEIETEAEIGYDAGTRTLFLPFSGEYTLFARMEGKKYGVPVGCEKQVRLFVEKPRTASGISVNGGNPALVVERERGEVSFFAEAESAFSVLPCPQIAKSEIYALGGEKYRVTLRFAAQEDFFFFLEREGEREEVSVSFEPFDFSVRNDLPVQSEEASLPVGEPVLFRTMPAVPAEGVSYEWQAEGDVLLEPATDGATCRVTARSLGNIRLTVFALRNGVRLDLFPKELDLVAVRRVRALFFTEKTDLGLARSRAVGGYAYEGETLVRRDTELGLLLSDGNERLPLSDDVLFSSSDEEIAQTYLLGGKLFVRPTGTGEITVSARWRGNASFGTDVRAEITLYAVAEGVEVRTSPALYRAEEEGRTVVLGADILLGTDEGGLPLPPAEREKLLVRRRSTYNTAFYRATGSAEPYLLHALEFTADVYGNGHSVSADLFTAEKDGGAPRWFRGPLSFVELGQVASVAAQDNAAFYVGDAMLFNLSLLGCGDGRLTGGSGYDLSALDLSGTVLEVAGNARILNCRVRNGRNVVRVFGGNGSGEEYFSQAPAGKERICPVIEGCHLAQGREFLLKIGTNRARKATGKTGAEPDLLDGNGAKYPLPPVLTEEFYDGYVLTDVTLKDSVLETSGLFCIGVECNFSGELLREGAEGSFEGWAGTGGTSYPAVLRLSGDIRMYDWKDVSLVDSGTLIRTELPELKLDIAAMLSYVSESRPEYRGLVFEHEGKRYVHGGVAFYGGGKNYSLMLGGEGRDFCEYSVNIDVLKEAGGNVGYQGQILPAAAGTRDFRFYLFDAEGKNGFFAQQSAEAEGTKYAGIRPLSPRENSEKNRENDCQSQNEML